MDIAYRENKLADLSPAWRFINTDGTVVADKVCMKKIFEKKEGDAVISVYSADSSLLINGIRIYISHSASTRSLLLTSCAQQRS